MITVYSSEFCHWCGVTKHFLRENGMAFKEIDVNSHPKEANKIFSKIGRDSVPVVDVDGEFIVGWDEAALRKAISKDKNSENSFL